MNNIFLFSTAITLIIISSGCEYPKKTKEKDFLVNNIIIPLPDNSLFLQEYVRMSRVTPIIYNEEGKDYMAVYNNKIHMIDIFNLTEKKAVKQIALEREGPNGLLIPDGLAYYRKNFLLNTRAGYKLVNNEGKVEKTILIPSFKNLYTKGYTPAKQPLMFINVFNFLFIDQQSGLMATPFYTNDINKEKINDPLLIHLFSLESTKEEVIEIPYPEEFSKRKEWGVLNSLHIGFRNNDLILTYGGSTNIYIYDRTKKICTKHEAKSTLTKNLITPVGNSTNSKITDINKSSLVSGYYFPLQYDPYRNVYWRLYMGSSDTPFNYNRDYCIAMIGEDFEVKKEVSLPNELELFPVLLIGKNGLWMNYSNEKAEEELWLFEVPTILFE